MEQKGFFPQSTEKVKKTTTTKSKKSDNQTNKHKYGITKQQHKYSCQHKLYNHFRGKNVTNKR